MGGRGSAGLSGKSRVDVGFGVTVSQKTMKLRQKIDKALGLSYTQSNSGYGLRIDILQGKTEAQVYKEDIERLSRINARAKESNRNKKTFVNSFGEATTREITSSTYQRNQKRMEDAVLRNMGVLPKRRRRK